MTDQPPEPRPLPDDDPFAIASPQIAKLLSRVSEALPASSVLPLRAKQGFPIPLLIPTPGKTEGVTPFVDSKEFFIPSQYAKDGLMYSADGRTLETELAQLRADNTGLIQLHDGISTENAKLRRDIADLESRLDFSQQKGAKDSGLVTSLLVEVSTLRAENERRKWQPIETAPRGIAKDGAPAYSWMFLAWGPEEDRSTGSGIRVDDKFYASATFYKGGPFSGKQYEQREIEVQPTHWQPLPTPPDVEGGSDGS